MDQRRRLQGVETDRRGDLAERTFQDLLDIWLGTAPGFAKPSALLPDSQRVDWTVQLPSLWSGVPPLIQDWQIKSTTSPRITTRNPFEVPAISYSLKSEMVAALSERARGRESFFLAVAVPKAEKQSISELANIPPTDRFDWYAINLHQYFRHISPADFPNQIFVPIANTLNLTTFCLIWGSQWVNAYYSTLMDPELLRNGLLVQEIDRIWGRSFHPVGWDFHARVLPNLEGEVSEEQFPDVNQLLGAGEALLTIRSELIRVALDLDAIRTYCPESLCGTTNLWLFCRAYHGFMETSSTPLAGSMNHNQRLLPVPDHNLKVIPQLLAGALWLVMLKYRILGVDVFLVQPPNHGVGKDHSYYGGSIGYFPWMSLTDDGTHWVVESRGHESADQHLDFIIERLDNVIIGSRLTLAEFSLLFGINRQDLELAKAVPICLLSPETRFVRHPVELWSKQRYAVIMGG